jgi:hypothetical protein
MIFGKDSGFRDVSSGNYFLFPGSGVSQSARPRTKFQTRRRAGICRGLYKNDHAPPPLAFCCGRRNMTTKRKIVGEVTEKVEPLAVAIEALVSAMLVYEKVGKEYQGLEPARAQLRKALSGAIHGV